MRNRIKTAAAAGAVVAGLTGVVIAGGFSPAAADPVDRVGDTTEWCDEYGNHEGWDAEEHTLFHDEMESHMSESMGMGMSMGAGFDFEGMESNGGMGGQNMGLASSMGR